MRKKIKRNKQYKIIKLFSHIRYCSCPHITCKLNGYVYEVFFNRYQMVYFFKDKQTVL